MLELCIRVKAENLHASSVLAPPVRKFSGISCLIFTDICLIYDHQFKKRSRYELFLEMD
jgi:hypothetical protein